MPSSPLCSSVDSAGSCNLVFTGFFPYLTSRILFQYGALSGPNRVIRGESNECINESSEKVELGRCPPSRRARAPARSVYSHHGHRFDPPLSARLADESNSVRKSNALLKLWGRVRSSPLRNDGHPQPLIPPLDSSFRTKPRQRAFLAFRTPRGANRPTE